MLTLLIHEATVRSAQARRRYWDEHGHAVEPRPPRSRRERQREKALA